MNAEASVYNQMSMSGSTHITKGEASCRRFGNVNGYVHDIEWSPNGRSLASAANDCSLRVWDPDTGEQRAFAIDKDLKGVYSLAWSSNGDLIATASGTSRIAIWESDALEPVNTLSYDDAVARVVRWNHCKNILSAAGGNGIRLWDGRTLKLITGYANPSDEIDCISWSPDGISLAYGVRLRTEVGIWEPSTGKVQKLAGHQQLVTSLAWHPNRNLLASGSKDFTIRLWDLRNSRTSYVLEGHTGGINNLLFTRDGRFLLSIGEDQALRIWRTDTWETAAVIDSYGPFGLALHPSRPLIATSSGKGIAPLSVNFEQLQLQDEAGSSYYANTKVVLLGDTGVGKSGLGLVLTGKPFVPTDSTHGRHVWTFQSSSTTTSDGHSINREVLLWDLAGQPVYRLVHQLHLDEVVIALVLFDSRSETDPFSGVRYWDRALRQAANLRPSSPRPLRFLVASRIDRGGVPVGRNRIQATLNSLGFDAFFETSAREGWGINELTDAIRTSIPWDMVPTVKSTQLFQQIKAFILLEKISGRVLSTAEDLYRAFTAHRESGQINEIRAEFDTCIARVESRGLIRRLSFGGLVLLQPELLDAYASAIVIAARDEPDGMGTLLEAHALSAAFRMSPEERVSDREQERLLLIATIEELIKREIALRESAEDGVYLIFPSQYTRERSDLPDPEGKELVIGFEGSPLSIYTTLAVRLSHSGIFTRKEMWRNAATYTNDAGELCGMFLREIEEGRAEVQIFYKPEVSKTTRLNFEQYVLNHLKGRALPDSVVSRRIFRCKSCGFVVTDQLLRLRQERRLNWVDCPACNSRIRLVGTTRVTSTDHVVQMMDATADSERERATAATVLQGKIETGDYDVFLCHNSKEKPEVKEIAQLLKGKGILPWLDEWELRPGEPWQRALETRISQIKSAAIFVGQKGIGPWQEEEIEALLREFVRRRCPVIPVVLKSARRIPQLPVFLQGRTWVDFRDDTDDALNRLLWGITGLKAERP